MTDRDHVAELRTYAREMDDEGHHTTANVMHAAADRLEAAENIIVIARKTCGVNNCNCPGAPKMKEALKP